MTEASAHKGEETTGADAAAADAAVDRADAKAAGRPTKDIGARMLRWIVRLLNVALLACLALSLGMLFIQLLDALVSLADNSINATTYVSHGWPSTHFGMGESSFVWYARKGTESAGFGILGTRMLWCSLLWCAMLMWPPRTIWRRLDEGGAVPARLRGCLA